MRNCLISIVLELKGCIINLTSFITLLMLVKKRNKKPPGGGKITVGARL
jgi:hypothetical protein